MPIDQAEAFKLQQQFLDRAAKAIEAARAGRAATVLDDGRQRVEALRERIAGAKKDREEIVARLDQRIAALEAQLARQEAGLAETRKNANTRKRK